MKFIAEKTKATFIIVARLIFLKIIVLRIAPTSKIIAIIA
jgi:hypothetical protein